MQIARFKACLRTLLLFLLVRSCHGQRPPALSDDIHTVKSSADPRVSIRFKSPVTGTCATVFPTQKQYSGYVSLPPHTITPLQQNYSINTFFWFVEARTNPDSSPLTVYINGGPGSSSMVGLFQETGPCEVLELAKDRLGTQARDWGWDRSSNMLYVDQPNQVGFSYDSTTDGSLNLISEKIEQPPIPVPSDQPAFTFLNGSFASNNGNHTANTTAIAAHAVWHMLQGFLGVFTQYIPASDSRSTQNISVGINLFAESYGGKYGPVFASTWEKQNLARRNSSNSKKTIDIHLQTLGIVQGCVDDLVQGSYYPTFANNNTYGITAISLVDQQAAASSYYSAGGCQQLITECRKAVNASDSTNEGDVAVVNDACRDAQDACQKSVISVLQSSDRNPYDITQKALDPFPPSTYLEYLNSADVQSAIGVPLNFTQSTNPVLDAFHQTGDTERVEPIRDIAYLLSLGIRVSLIYGDRDYLCNWVGGEQVSFEIAAQTPGYDPFYTAGYSDIVVNDSYVGGVVRQYGNLSFSRVYDAGHLVAAYQPETAFTIFARSIMGNDISFGQEADLSTYKSNGTANSTYTSKAPHQQDPICYVRDMKSKCSPDQISKLRAGEGTVINGVWYEDEDDWKVPASTLSDVAGYPGHGPSSTIQTGGAAPSDKAGGQSTSMSTIPTGVFTATATPTNTKKSGVGRRQEIDIIVSMLLILTGLILPELLV